MAETDDVAGGTDDVLAAVAAVADRADQLVDAARRCAAAIQAGGTLVIGSRPERRAHADHVAVEFVHPVITGKRAVPALVADVGPDAAARHDIHLWLGPGPVPDPASTTLTLDLATIAGTASVHLADVTMVLTHHLLWELTHAVLDHRPPDGYLAELGGGRRAGVDATDVVAKVERSADTIRTTLIRHRVLLADLAPTLARSGGRVWTFGQGGSAADAALVAARLGGDCLSSNAAVLTALVNDIGPDAMYVRQVATHVRSEDLVIALTTSGTSPAVLAGLAAATSIGARTLACTGSAGLPSGGDKDPVATDVLDVDSDSIHRIQEAHLAAVGVIAGLLAGR